jgi:ABC-type dipeptide/oligopeptide/nickel transport system permease component
MGTYVIRRLLQSVFVLLGVTLLVYFILFQTGDPTFLSVSTDASQQEVERVRHELGFDRPWYVQYGDFVARAAHGDFGVSLRSRLPALPLVVERMPATLELAAAAMLLSIAVAVPLGIVAATHRRTMIDTSSMVGGLVGQSAPGFWIGLVLILVFGVDLRWFPVSGRGGLSHLVLPGVTLAMYSMGRNARVVRASMLDALGYDFIRTAYAKGASRFVVLYRHALRNALLPIVTLVGLDFGVLLGGAIITETVFAWPGVGRLVVNAIYEKDFPIVEAAVVVIAAIFVILNLCVDLAYGYLDPRIRYS